MAVCSHPARSVVLRNSVGDTKAGRQEVAYQVICERRNKVGPLPIFLAFENTLICHSRCSVL